MTHIVLVDDDPMSGALVSAILEESGYELTLFENAIDALEFLPTSHDVALVISDMNMPLVSGLDLFVSMRDHGLSEPFILLTGDDPEPLKAEQPLLDACIMKDSSLDTSLPTLVQQILSKR